MLQLDLSFTSKGIPKRILVRGARSFADTIKGASGGTATTTKAGWSLPLEPTILRRLNAMRNIEYSKPLQKYLEHLRHTQIVKREAIADGSALAPQDNLRGAVQRASVRFLSEGKRVILAHDMGIGKTVIACYALNLVAPTRTLIVCPDAVKWSWEEHLRQWTIPSCPVVLTESRKLRKADLIKFSSLSFIHGNRVTRDDGLARLLVEVPSFILIMNYEQLTIHRKVLEAEIYDVLIADEAHRVKDRKSHRTQATNKLAEKSAYVWLLTGTPIRNTYTDVFTLLRMCDPTRFTSYWNFIGLYMHTVDNYFGGRDVIGLQDKTTFNQMLSQYMFRKTKQEALPELPAKIYSDRRLQLNPEQEKAYVSMEKEFALLITKQLDSGVAIDEILTAQNTVTQLMRLRQICLTPALLGGVADSAKLDILKDLIEDLKLEGTQFLIFTWFRGFLPYVEYLLKAQKISYGCIQGGQKAEQKRTVEQGLRNGSLQGVLGTIGAMGEGMNLQAATVAIFCDIDWVPAVNNQAEDRIHREGITTSPTILRLYHPGTIEDDIRVVCSRKARIERETVGRVEVVRNMLCRVNYCDSKEG